MTKGDEKMLENARLFLKIYSIIAVLVIAIRMSFKNSTPFDLAALIFVFIYVADV